MPQIVCENASLGYDGKPIVTGLNFTVNAGDYLCSGDTIITFRLSPSFNAYLPF